MDLAGADEEEDDNSMDQTGADEEESVPSKSLTKTVSSTMDQENLPGNSQPRSGRE